MLTQIKSPAVSAGKLQEEDTYTYGMQMINHSCCLYTFKPEIFLSSKQFLHLLQYLASRKGGKFYWISIAEQFPSTQHNGIHK